MPDSAQQEGNYVVVARRYRPRGFDELVGQEHIGKALRNAIETSRVGHAYLFTGARGVGKTSTARIFAKALNNPDGPSAAPDPESDIAQAIDSGEDVDVIEIDGASNRGIDEIRSLRANVGVRPSRSRYKIYIIDEVHMLTGPAFNALLKTLEEPPEHVKFIFCTTDPEKIPITVLSRCQRFDFAPVEVNKIVKRLAEIVENEGAKADSQALELIARRAAGSMRDSQSLLEQVLSFSDGHLDADTVHAMLGTADDARLHELATAMADRNAADAMRMVDAAIDAGVDAGRLTEQLLGYFRDLMAVAVGCDASLQRHTSASMQQELSALAQKWGLQTVLAVVGLVDQTLVRIRLSVHARVLLEATVVQICHLPDLQNIANLAAASEQTLQPAPAKPATEKKKLAANPSGALSSPPVPQPSEARPSDVQPPKAQPSETASPPRPTTAGAGPADARPLSKREADALWGKSMPQLEDMTASLARSVIDVESPAAGKMLLTFAAESKLAMQRCETPEHQNRLAQTLSQVAGFPVRVEVKAAPPKPRRQQQQAANKGPSRMQRMKEIENNDLIRSCVEFLGAEIVRVDKPK